MLILESATASTILNYQGRISVAGKLFTGHGHFIFSIVDGAGDVLWSSGPFPMQQTTNLPAGVLSVDVSNGLYSVHLGDTSTGMAALEPETLLSAFSPKLRIWFNDGAHGWQHAGEEVSLASALGSAGESTGAGLNSAAATAILRELRQLRLIVERQRSAMPVNQPAPKPPEEVRVTVSIGNAPALGRADAPLVLVEFTDFQCPYCKRFNESIMPELVKTYVETGKLRVFSRSLALPMHPNAEPAALAALCANQQEKFWQMRELLFGSSPMLSVSNFLSAAEALKLDSPAFRACLEQRAFADEIRKDINEANAVGITATPSFVLGKPENGKVTGLLIVGARTLATFDAEVKRLLAETEPQERGKN